MKNLFLSLMLFATCGVLTQTKAQTNSDNQNNQKIESFDEMLNEIEKGVAEMMETLRSAEFQKELERAQTEAEGQLNITQDADGNYLFNGEVVDISGITDAAKDLSDLFQNDFDISGDLDEVMEKSGEAFQDAMKEFEKIMEENFQNLQDLDIDIDLDDNCKDKKKSKKKGKATIQL